MYLRCSVRISSDGTLKRRRASDLNRSIGVSIFRSLPSPWLADPEECPFVYPYPAQIRIDATSNRVEASKGDHATMRGRLLARLQG
jgi:hypothetical protein